jgi:vacuolar protein sorting-associated protein 13A/C
MSQLKLTKIVSILPFFVVSNNTPYPLRYMEENEQADLWLDVAPNEVQPFWPSTDSMRMYVKHEKSNVSSQHFSICIPQQTTLRMDRGVRKV